MLNHECERPWQVAISFVECVCHDLQETTVASIVAAAMFLGAYGNALRQLRFLNSAGRSHASRATNTSAAASSAVRDRIAGSSSKPVITFKEFLRDALPVALVHSQALAVSVVFSGFAHGACNGYIADISDVKDYKKPLSGSPK